MIDMGLALVSEEGASSSTVPDPSTDTDFPLTPWLWRGRYRIYASAVDDQNVDVREIDLDLRGRRKIGNGQLVLITDSTPNQGTAVAVQVTGIVRMLLLVG